MDEPTVGPYEIALSSAARRASCEVLPLAVAEAAWALVTGPIAADPHRLGKPLLPPLAGIWSARAGDYRVLYRIDEATRTVRVERIERRADVYRSP
ncbi:MAG: type II toxin-antitoxin system RelE family toxin [Sporichthyaceae bacterium]